MSIPSARYDFPESRIAHAFAPEACKRSFSAFVSAAILSIVVDLRVTARSIAFL